MNGRLPMPVALSVLGLVLSSSIMGSLLLSPSNTPQQHEMPAAVLAAQPSVGGGEIRIYREYDPTGCCLPYSGDRMLGDIVSSGSAEGKRVGEKIP